MLRDTYFSGGTGQFDVGSNDAFKESEELSMTISVNWRQPNAMTSGLGIKDHYNPLAPFDFLEDPSLGIERGYEPDRFFDEAPEPFEYDLPLIGDLDDCCIEPKFDFC